MADKPGTTWTASREKKRNWPLIILLVFIPILVILTALTLIFIVW